MGVGLRGEDGPPKLVQSWSRATRLSIKRTQQKLLTHGTSSKLAPDKTSEHGPPQSHVGQAIAGLKKRFELKFRSL